MINKIIFLISLFLTFSEMTYATQSVVVDASAGSCTDTGTANHGNGTCTVSAVTAFNQSETITLTALGTGPTANFSVVGSISGSLGTIKSGAVRQVKNLGGFNVFKVNLTDAGTAYTSGDDFSFVTTHGTALNKATFDAFTLAQITSNGAVATSSLTANSVVVGSAANTISALATIVNTGTLTLPTSTDTLVGRATTDTLTNKTINQAVINGNTSGSTPASGEIGQEIISTALDSSPVNSPGTGTWGDVTTITLPAGRFEVSGNVFFLRNSATFTQIDLEASIITASGNSSTGTVNALNKFNFSLGAFALTWSNLVITFAPIRVYCDGTNITIAGTTTTGTTLRLKELISSYSSGTPQTIGTLRAVRIN